MPVRVREAQAIVDAARDKAGLEDFHSESFRDGLALIIFELNRMGQLTPEGAALFEKKAITDLSNRLRIDEYIRRNPGVLDEKIEKPIVILGMPRTGSTLLSNLLAMDPNHRSPLLWEFNDPVPPVSSEELYSGPRALAAQQAEQQANAANRNAPRFRPTSVMFPIECIYVQAHDFKALSLEAVAPMPAYADWVLHCDMTSAYDYHRRYLQMAQSKAGGTWNLKMPSHALHIRWLLRAYPDARIIWTHRDPYAATASLLSLIGTSQARHIGAPDKAFLASNYPHQLHEHVKRMMDAAPDIPQEQLFHHSYAEIVRDPIGAVRKIYDWLGKDLTPQTEAAMRKWIDENPQKKWVTHSYRLEEYGVSIEQLKPLFADYLAAYDVEPEQKN